MFPVSWLYQCWPPKQPVTNSLAASGKRLPLLILARSAFRLLPSICKALNLKMGASNKRLAKQALHKLRVARKEVAQLQVQLRFCKAEAASARSSSHHLALKNKESAREVGSQRNSGGKISTVAAAVAVETTIAEKEGGNDGRRRAQPGGHGR